MSKFGGDLMTEKVKENAEVEDNQQEILDDQKENEATEKNDVEEMDEVTKLKADLDEMQSRLLRAQADFDNYRKRTIKEKEDISKYAAIKLIDQLLAPYDNLERAIKFSADSNNIESLTQGVEMVFKQLEEILTNEGLEPIEAIGQQFNPELHQAVMQVESEEFNSGIVVDELQKGYKFKGKVVRPSMVKVNI